MGARSHAASHEPYRSALPPLRLRAVRSACTAVRRAGGRVAASAPAPSNAGRRSAIIAGFGGHFTSHSGRPRDLTGEFVWGTLGRLSGHSGISIPGFILC